MCEKRSKVPIAASEGCNAFTLSEVIESDNFHAAARSNEDTYVPFGDDLQMVFSRGIYVCKYYIYIILSRVMSYRQTRKRWAAYLPNNIETLLLGCTAKDTKRMW